MDDQKKIFTKIIFENEDKPVRCSITTHPVIDFTIPRIQSV